MLNHMKVLQSIMSLLENVTLYCVHLKSVTVCYVRFGNVTLYHVLLENVTVCCVHIENVTLYRVHFKKCYSLSCPFEKNVTV